MARSLLALQVPVAQLAVATVFPAAHFVLLAVEPPYTSNFVLHTACAVQQAVLSPATVAGAHGAPAQLAVAEALAIKPVPQSVLVITLEAVPSVFLSHVANLVQQAVLSPATVAGAHGAPAQAPVAEAVAK